MTTQEKAFFFKTGIDPEFVNLSMQEFIEAVALTPSEKKQAKEIIEEAESKNIEI